MSRSWKWIIGIAVAVLLPLFPFLIARMFSDGHIKIPKRYRIDRVDTFRTSGKVVLDTQYHKVAEVKLINQLGDSVSLNENLKGKMLAINFMFTTCKSICPIMTSNIRIMQKSFLKKSGDLVQFVSISVDPERDTVAALRRYADLYQADHDHWYFLTGKRDKIYHYAKEELGLMLDAQNAEEIMHSGKIVLVDSARNIRGYYDATDPVSLSKCADDIIIISMEK